MGKKWLKSVWQSQTASQTTCYFDPNPDLGGDEHRIGLCEALLETVDDRLRDDPETKAAYDRLIAEGISAFDSKMFLANLASREIWHALREQPIPRETYLQWLSRLPDLPGE